MAADIAIKGTADIEVIKHRIYDVRGMQIMLDRDLAELYGVETKRLNEAVRRNIERFPEDFMFKLNKNEWVFLRSQFVTLKEGAMSADTEDVDVVETSLRSQIATSSWGGTRKLPNAFTELGIAMLSSVLRSETAIQVNINIMRAFVAIRHAIGAWQGVNMKVDQLSHKVDNLNARVDEILHEQCRRLRTPLNRKKKVSNENNMEMAVQISALCYGCRA